MKPILPLFLALIPLAFSQATAQPLDIFFIDVEGGAATLIVTPQKESVLIDSGWRRDDGRDARRIHQVATQEAGLSQIDYLVTTHFHRDHYGSVLRLSDMIPIRSFLDSGPRTELREDPQFHLLYTEYIKANRGLRQTIRPGDEIPLKKGRLPLELLTVASNGNTLKQPGAENPECSRLRLERDDPTDNARSVGLLLRFGRFRFLANGDLTWNVESKLVCPTNVVGRVHAYLVTHHGLKTSNNPVLLQSIQPTVAIMNNGATKGGDPEVMARLRALDSLRDLFQLHLNLQTRAEDNTDRELIANLEPEVSCSGHWIRLSVDPNAANFTVTNGRNGVSRTYPIR